MNHYSPTTLPKVRSAALMKAMRGYPCTLRIAGMIPGHGCASDDTVVGCHLTTPGKGTATKSTDLAVVAACAHCHALLDRVDHRIAMIEREYPSVLGHRLLMGLIETHALLARDGIITVKGGELL